MNEIYSFKNILKEMIDIENSKIWLSEKQGRRMECIFTIGTEQFIDSIVIFEDDNYVLRGQNISNQLKDKIINEVSFNE